MLTLQSPSNAAALAAGTTNSASQSAPLAGTATMTVAIEVNVTAIAGTSPSLATTVQWSADGTTWADASPADAFPAITAVGATVMAFTVKGLYYRMAYTLTGTTPTATVTTTATFM